MKLKTVKKEREKNMNNRAQNLLMWGIILTFPLGIMGLPVLLFWWAMIIGGIWMEYRKEQISPRSMQKSLMNNTFDGWMYKNFMREAKEAEVRNAEREKLPPEERPKPDYYGLDKLGLTPEELAQQFRFEIAVRLALDMAYRDPKCDKKSWLWKDFAIRQALPPGNPVVLREGDRATRQIMMHRIVDGVNKRFYFGEFDYGAPNEYPFKPILRTKLVGIKTVLELQEEAKAKEEKEAKLKQE